MHWHINISVFLCIQYQWVSDWTYIKPHPFNRFMWCGSTLVKTKNPILLCVGFTWNHLFKGNQIMKHNFKKRTHTIDSRCPKIILKQFNMHLDDFGCICGNQTYRCAVRNTFLMIFDKVYEILRFELRLIFVECLPDGCSMKPIIVLDHLCNCEKLYFHLYLYIDWCLMQEGEGNHVVPLPTRSYVYWINFSVMHFLTGTQSNQLFSSIPNTFWIVLFNMMSYIVCCRFLQFFNDAVEDN